MDMYGQKSRSIPQKITGHAVELILIWLAYQIFFGEMGNRLADIFGIQNAVENTGRRTLIFVLIIITFLRFSYMMIFLLKRRIPLEEAISVPAGFALYYLGFPILALSCTAPLGGIDYLAGILFIAGSVLNTGGEVMRDRWKKNPGHKGKLYTGGFFRYSRHINYFGDLLWITAFSMLTRNWYAAAIPVMLFCFFAFFNGPKLDAYLKSKYGGAFNEYAAHTKMLIPFIY